MSDFFYREDTGLNIYVTIFDDKIFIDQDTINSILTFLNKIYINYLEILFLISCMSGMTCLYICKQKKKTKDYVLINNPKGSR
jgi:hypothetical protein